MKIVAIVGWIVAALVALGLALSLVTRADDDTATGALVVLTGASGSVTESDQTTTLMLDGVPGTAAFFTEHPAREAGAISTSSLGATVAAAGSDPLNAAIVVNIDGARATLAFELLALDYDAVGTTLTAVIVPLPEGATGLDFLPEPFAGDQRGPLTFGAVELFIDAIPIEVNSQITDVAATDDLFGDGGDGGIGGDGAP